MARFFVEHLPDSDVEYTLTGENAEHAKVLRLRAGEEVTLCDGRGMECPCRVEAGLTLRTGAPLPSPAEPKVRAALYLAFPKADKAEHVIQKATELGAAEIVLFPSRYCVSRPDDKSLAKKLDRWQKIARSAAEQSRRGVIPAVRALDSYGQAITEAAQADLPVLFYENEEQLTLREAISENSAGASDVCSCVQIALMTGAEGGFSEEEIAQARAAGLKICTLGPRILRCETAPLAGLTAVMYALGEI